MVGMVNCDRLSRAVSLVCLLFLSPGLTLSDETVVATATVVPRVAIIIDDLGNEHAAGIRTAQLFGPVACAILPHTPFADAIARRAHEQGKEVMLHLPLQPIEKEWLTGAGTIDIDSTRDQMRRILASNLGSIPHLNGVNTHMGSLLTRHPGHMRWLMSELKDRGDLFFVDSYTTASSVALQMAREEKIPAVRRHVFLDNEARAQSIDAEFKRLKQLARKNGYAVAIGHPHAETLEYLESELPRLEQDGYELVSIGSLVNIRSSGSSF